MPTSTTQTTIDDTMPAPLSTDAPPKWWGRSLTIWGAVVTGLAAVLPAIGPAFGFQVSAASIHTVADQIVAVAQAAAGLAGTLMAIYGRARASQPLAQKLVLLRV